MYSASPVCAKHAPSRANSLRVPSGSKASICVLRRGRHSTGAARCPAARGHVRHDALRLRRRAFHHGDGKRLRVRARRRREARACILPYPARPRLSSRTSITKPPSCVYALQLRWAFAPAPISAICCTRAPSDKADLKAANGGRDTVPSVYTIGLILLCMVQRGRGTSSAAAAAQLTISRVATQIYILYFIINSSTTIDSVIISQ